MIIDRISSPTNPLIKSLRALDRKKTRLETGLFLAEGARLIEQGLRRNWPLKTLLVSEQALGRDYVREIADMAAAQGARIAAAPDRLISKVTRKDNPQTLVAAFEQQRRPLEALKAAPDRPGLWIGLYEVRDPGNLGTILRTADCAGLDGVILIGKCCDPYSVETVRASMGSIFDMPFAEADFSAFEAWRKSLGASLIAASVNGTVRHDQTAMDAPSVILMGNEQAGLPPEAEAACDTLCLIPMRGGADSLNLAQATAVMTYEAWRQRGFA